MQTTPFGKTSKDYQDEQAAKAAKAEQAKQTAAGQDALSAGYDVEPGGYDVPAGTVSYEGTTVGSEAALGLGLGASASDISAAGDAGQGYSGGGGFTGFGGTDGPGGYISPTQKDISKAFRDAEQKTITDAAKNAANVVESKKAIEAYLEANNKQESYLGGPGDGPDNGTITNKEVIDPTEYFNLFRSTQPSSWLANSIYNSYGSGPSFDVDVYQEADGSLRFRDGGQLVPEEYLKYIDNAKRTEMTAPGEEEA